MRLAVIIATYNRKWLLPRVLQSLDRQTQPPDEVIISAPDESHSTDYTPEKFSVTLVCGSKGLCAQRNRALDRAGNRFDIITFFDDDFFPSVNYLEKVRAAFSSNPIWAVITGCVPLDGVHGPGLTTNEAISFLSEEEKVRESYPIEPITRLVGGYGCNMSVRFSYVDGLRFDERLPLYGWQEDIDYTTQLGRKGEVVTTPAIYGVHLGVKSGRVSGVRLGYSQVSNPLYLLRKGTMPGRFALSLVVRNLAVNLAKVFWQETHIDRRGRLRGNLIAIWDLVRGKIEPERILQL